MRACAIALALLLKLLAALAEAQTISARLEGVVSDASGAFVPDASVVVSELNTGITRTGVTSGIGVFSFPALPTGTYRVEVRRSGSEQAFRMA